MAQTIFAPEALADLAAIYDFVAVDDRLAAERLIERLERQAAILAATPGIGRRRLELRHDLRSSAVGRYVIFYRPVTDGIEIVRVLHGMRDLDAMFNEEE